MRPGLEGELLQGVQAWQPQARIVGVTSSVLYGTSVSLVLLHRPRVGNHLPAVPEVDELLPGADLQMPWARWQSDRQLGRIGLDPGLLLRVKVRAVDRPVLAASTLAGLERALTARIALGRGTSGIQVWYAQIKVVEGSCTSVRLVVRLPGELLALAAWTDKDWQQLERDVQRGIAADLALMTNRSSDTDPLHHNPIVEIRLLQSVEIGVHRPFGSLGSVSA